MILEVSLTIPRRAKMTIVAIKNPIKTNEAPRVSTLAAAFTGGASVGIGLGEVVVGGGTTQALPSDFMVRPSWQTQM
jgi:uncharacterized membrane-anchored protein YitT (DUF2179 family)